MIAGMDLLTTIPPVLGAVSNLCVQTLQGLAFRVLTMVLATFIVAGVSIFVISPFVWLWVKRAIGEMLASPSMARH
jgi:hypothetical protein